MDRETALTILCASGWISAVVVWFAMARLLAGQTREYLDIVDELHAENRKLLDAMFRWRRLAVWALTQADRLAGETRDRGKR